MKNTVFFAIFLILTSCSIDVKKNNVSTEKILENRLEIRKMQIKVANLTQKIDLVEKNNYELIQQTNTLQKKRKQQQQTSKKSVWEPIKVSSPTPETKEAQTWSPKEKEIAVKLIDKFETNTEKKDSNSELVGNKLPFLRFINSEGEVVNLQEILPNKKILLVILRGFAGSVCLVCSSQTIALSKNVEKFEQKNTQIVLVYPGDVESIPHFVSSVQNMEEQFSSPFPIVLDVDLSLVNTFKINGSLAKPSSLLIDQKGIVRYAYVGKNPGDRPTIPSLLEVIDKLEK